MGFFLCFCFSKLTLHQRASNSIETISSVFSTMRVSTLFFLFNMVTAASAFGVVKPITTSKSITSLYALPKPEDCTPEMLKDIDYMNRWGEIKVLPRAEAEATLKGAELEAYNNYHQHISDDLERMTEVAKMIVSSLEKKKEMKPKTKGQRKRDKWAKVQAREAAKAAAAK